MTKPTKRQNLRPNRLPDAHETTRGDLMLKKLANKSEKEVYDQIVDPAINFGASVYRKVRKADVVDIDRLDSRTKGTFALQGHFDFVVVDSNEMPRFVVEYDCPGHVWKNGD